MSNIKLNPLLKHGMVVCKGKDPRRGYYYHTVDVNRLVEGRRSICFLEMVETVEKLGFKVQPHWTSDGNRRGYFSIVGLKYHGPYDSVDEIEVEPVVKQFLEGNLANKHFKNLLIQENE